MLFRSLSEDAPTWRLREVQTLTLLSIIEQAAGDLGEAEATLLEALELARAQGLRRPQASILQSLGGLNLNAGRHAQALLHLQAGLTLAREIGWVVVAANAQYNMAMCHRELGNAALAAELALSGEADAARCENRDVQGRCMLLRGRLTAAAGDATAAQAAYEQAGAVFEAIAAAPFVCLVRSHLAGLLLAEGRLAQALQLTERIAEDLAAGLSMSATDEPPRAHLLCHRAWAAVGDPRAAQAIATAHADLLALAARAGDEATRRSILENVSLHREVVAAWAAANGG